MKRILTPEREAILVDERRVLGDLRAALARHGAGPETDRTLQRSIAQLDELFLLVIVGEFNSGKSAFVNALLGVELLAEGVVPTTTEVEVVRYGPAVARAAVEDHLYAVTAPVEMLRDIQIVDTPGTNAIMREHEAITARFVPRADLVLFVTSADRPFTETERAFLERIRDWGKKVVVVINKVDIIEREDQVTEVRTFVTRHATELLATSPEVFAASARLAMRAKLGEPRLWGGSRFEALERYITETLDEESRLRLKLLNPIGVATRLLEEQQELAASRIALLQEDIEALAEVDRQLEVYRADMARDVAYRMSDIEKTLVDMEQRGHRYFDDTLRIGRVVDLLNRSRIQQEFEREVVRGTPQQIERKVGELIDWMVDADFRQWRAVTERLAERRRQHRDRILGADAPSAFHADRTRLIDSVGREAQRVVEGYDKAREAQALADGARNAVAASAAVGAGALGLGTVVSLAATSAAADVTGIVMAGVLAAIGFFILPARRRRAKEEMREKVTALRRNLAAALRGEFEREMTRGRQRIDEAIAPYSRFVRAEHTKLTTMRVELDAAAHEIRGLHVRIEGGGELPDSRN